jgi:hypothetical protein
MKKLHTLIFTITFFIAGIANAQINKGAILLGGNLGASAYKTKDGSTELSNRKSLNISPVFGKAVKENLVFGVNASVGIYKNETISSYTQKQSFYGAGIFLRKYKTLGKSGFSAFIQGDFGGGYSVQESQNGGGFNSSEVKRYTIGISAYPGLSYAINRRFQLETGFINLVNLGFSSEKSTNTISGNVSSNKTKGVDFSTNLNNFGSSLYLGFRFLLNK